VPLISIVESLQIDNKLINRVSGDMVLYRLRDDNVPILPIYQLFNLATDCTEIDNALLVVVEADGQKIGLMVDDLLAQQQVVVKSLKDNYQQVTGISGATILGDGSVAMILDIPGMIAMALKQAQQVQLDKSNRENSNIGELI
jgi:two-component system chemotaxis sensor kinase CheA